MKEYLDHEPLEIEKVGPELYIKRTNIIEVEHEADPVTGQEAYTSWEADSEFITASELILARQDDADERQQIAEDAIIELAELIGGE